MQRLQISPDGTTPTAINDGIGVARHYVFRQHDNSTNFHILDYVSFMCSSTRPSTSMKLMHSRSLNVRDRHWYFNRLPRLWNAFPSINVKCSPNSIKRALKDFLWSHFTASFYPTNICSFHFVCPCCNCMATPPPPVLSPLIRQS